MGYRSRLNKYQVAQKQRKCPGCSGKSRVVVLKELEPIRRFRLESCQICSGTGRVDEIE